MTMRQTMRRTIRRLFILSTLLIFPLMRPAWCAPQQDQKQPDSAGQNGQSGQSGQSGQQKQQDQGDSQTPKSQQGESGDQPDANQGDGSQSDQKQSDSKAPGQKSPDQKSPDQKADDKDSGWSSSSSSTTAVKEAPPELPKYNPLPAEQDVDVGTFYMHKGDMDAAISRFEDAIQLKADYAKPRMLLAQIYEKRGDKANAVKYYREYLQVYPHAPDAKKVQAKIAKLTTR
jgi:tetratricopeptide (TPR) repeat protein